MDPVSAPAPTNAAPSPSPAPSAPSAPSASPSRGNSAALSTPRTAPTPTRADGGQNTPTTGPDGAAAPEAPKKREPIIFKRPREDGSVEEIDIAEAFESYKHRVKVDGQEIEVPFKDLEKSYERVRASMKRFEQAAAKDKEVAAREQKMAAREAEIVATLRDPAKALALVKRTLGDELFVRAISQELSERVKYERLTPEQRAEVDRRRKQETQQQRLDRELSERKRMLDEREKKFQAAEDERMRTRIRASITEALTAAKLPTNDHVIGLVASKRAAAMRAGASMTMEEAIGEVRGELRELFGAFGSDPEQLREMVGDDGAEALRRAELAKLEQQPGRRQQPPVKAPAPAAPKRRRTLEDLQRELAQRG